MINNLIPSLEKIVTVATIKNILAQLMPFLIWNYTLEKLSRRKYQVTKKHCNQCTCAHIEMYQVLFRGIDRRE